MRRLVRAPLVHFVLAGAVSWAAFGDRPGDAGGAAPERELVVTAARTRALRADFARDHGRPPTAAEEAELVARAVDDELLYRAALAVGLDRDDRSVRWRLAETMAFLAPGDAPPAARAAEAAALGLDREDPVVRRMLVTKMRLLAKRAAERDADDEVALRDWWARHRDRFTRPAAVTFRHRFFARDARGARLAADATRARDALRRGGAADPGDPFFGPAVVEARSEAEIAATFGADFARAVGALPPGTWHGPVASPWGLHVVRVEERLPPATAPFEAVRTAVRLGLVAERHEARLAELLADLRRRWVVRVEPPDGVAS